MGEAGLVRTTTSFSLVGHWPTSRCESALALDLSEAEHGNHVRLITDINYNQISNQIFIRDLSTCFFFFFPSQRRYFQTATNRARSFRVSSCFLASAAVNLRVFLSLNLRDWSFTVRHVHFFAPRVVVRKIAVPISDLDWSRTWFFRG